MHNIIESMVLRHKHTVLDYIIETMVHIRIFTLSNILVKLMVGKYICAHYPIKVLIKWCLFSVGRIHDGITSLFSSVSKLSNKMGMKID